jgi:hypothetical protein
MTKQQLLDKLQSSEELIRIAYVPVSEVINWVNELEGGITQEQIDDVSESIINDIQGEGLDLIEDYDLEMSYREVELTSVDFSDRRIKDIVKGALNELLEKEGD